MAENLKALLAQIVSYLSLYEIATLLAIFFIFIMLFTLGLLLRGRKFIAKFFFFNSMVVVFSTPFVLHFVMKNVLYKIEVDITNAHAMQYTKGFFVAGEITHIGKIPINECYVSVDEVRNENGSKVIKAFNSIFPRSSSGAIVNIDINVGEQKKFATIVPHFEAKEPFLYRIYVDCYLSNKFAQKIQKKVENADIIKPKLDAQEIKDEQKEEVPQEQEEQVDATQEDSITPLNETSQDSSAEKEDDKKDTKEIIDSESGTKDKEDVSSDDTIANE